jgi:hypothetical protein
VPKKKFLVAFIFMLNQYVNLNQRNLKNRSFSAKLVKAIVNINYIADVRPPLFLCLSNPTREIDAPLNYDRQLLDKVV